MKKPSELSTESIIASYIVLSNDADLSKRKSAEEMINLLIELLKKKKTLDNPLDFFKDNSQPYTVLEFAVVRKHLALIIKLLNAGADPNAGTRQPLYLACQPDFFDNNVLTVLLTFHLVNKNVIKTKVNELNQATNCAPLHLACVLNNAKAVKLLLGHPEIDVYKNAQNNQTNGSALRMALFKENSECVEFLVEKMAKDEFPLKCEIIDSIQALLIHNQLSKATLLLNKIAEYRNKYPHEKISKNIEGTLNALFRFIIDKPIDILLYNAFINATKININDTVKVRIENKDIEWKVLPWICLTPNENREITYEWIQFILNEGFDLNHIEQQASLFYVLVTLITPDILKVILENGKVEQSYIEASLELVKKVKDAQKIKMLEDHLLVRQNYTLVVEGEPLSIEMYRILTSDDERGFTRIFKGKVKENLEVILFCAIENGAKKILLHLLKDLNPFTIRYKNTVNAFTIILMQGLFDVIDSLWNTYLVQEKKGLDKALQNCKSELLLFKAYYTEVPALYFEILFNKIQALETLHIQKQEQDMLSSISSYAADTKGFTFFKCISSRKYMLEVHPTFSKEEGAKEVVELDVKEKESSIQQTWFDNKALNLEAFISIEKADSPSYLVFLPNVDVHPNKVFENQSRYHFDPSCMKTLTGLELKMAFSIEGQEYDFEVSHELKSKSTKDRILIAKRPSNEGGATLYVAFKYVEDGFHEEADIKKACASIKNAKALELDFLFENHKSNKPF